MSRTGRLKRIEAHIAQQEGIAETEGLREVAEIVRNRVIEYLAMHRRGEPIPEPMIRHNSPAHRALQLRLDMMRSRLMRYAELRDTYGIR